jgi:hypothetical protein
MSVFTGLEQGEQRRQLGRAHARACGREMKLPDEHDSAKVNGSVQLELRGVATGVSAAAWQLACEGVRACEHARAQEEQGSTPAVAGVREQNAGGEREQSGVAKVDRDNALRGGDVVLRTEDHGQERGFPGDDEKVGGACLSSHMVWPQKGEALALACVSIGRPKGGVHVLTGARSHVGGLATAASSAVARRGVRLRAYVRMNTCTDLA